MLKTGPMPVMVESRKKKSKGEDESDDLEVSDLDDLPQAEIPARAAARGTILITLRNVEPYTLW